MELKKEIESLLFSSGKVMSEDDLSELTQHPKKEIFLALEELKKDYDSRDTSLMIVKRGDGWKLNVREKYVNLVTKIVADTELPFPVLETLAVIAYKSPKAMQSDIIKARGTNAYEHITELIDSGFIERRKEGRSFKVFLTTKFFEYFDVEGDKDIKEYLKDIQPADSSKHVKKKLGSLEVVDLPEEAKEKQKVLGESGEYDAKSIEGLEVVDDMPESKDDLGDAAGADDVFSKKITADDVKPDDDFLSEMEKKIDALSKKNDELDSDESFKRQNTDENPANEEKNDDEASGKEEVSEVSMPDFHKNDDESEEEEDLL